MRPSWDQHFLAIAQEVAKMSTCARRQVGCVLVDDRNVILATGFNGVPHGFDHCRENPGYECPGAKSPSGTNLDACLAIHSEQNALLHCSDITRVRMVYCTTSPCIGCVKAILASFATRIVFLETYPQSEAVELWTRYPFFSPNRPQASGHRTWERMRYDGTVEVLASSGLR